MNNQPKSKEEIKQELNKLQEDFSYLKSLKNIDVDKRNQLKKELAVALKEIASQNKKAEKLASQLIITNLNIKFENKEKLKRGKELVIANIELAFQNKEKAKRAAELIIANKELAFQNEEKEKRAEESLKENEDKFRAFYELGLVGLTITSPEKGWIKVNNYICEMLGYSEEELLQMTWAQLTHPDDLVADNEQFNRVISGEIDGYQLEKRFISKSGGVIFTNLVVRCVREQDRSVEYVLAMVDNITERKKAEEEIKKLSLAVRQNSSIIMITDFDGTIEYVNEAFRKTTGYSSEEVIGKNPKILSSGNKTKEEYHILWETIKSGNVWKGEFLNKKKNGQLFYESASIFPLMNTQGTIINFVAIKEDITERKKAEENLNARNSILEFSYHSTLNQLLQKTLDEIEILTESKIAFFHFVEEDQITLSLQTWSTNTLQNMCTAEGQGSHYPIDQAGVWADCVSSRSAVIHNDYASLPHKKGLPEGHATVLRELVVPIFRNEKIVAILGFGNKERNYDETDVQTITHIADLAWDIAERKRAEEKLISSKKQLELISNHIPVFLAQLDSNNHYKFVNQPYAALFRLKPEDIIGKHPKEILGTKAFKFADPFMDIALSGQPTHYELKMPNLPNEPKILNVKYVPDFNETGGVEGFIAAITDVTESKQAEEKIKKANRIYAVTSQINQSIVRIHTQKELFNQICHIAIGAGKFRMAWIGMEDEATNIVNPVSFAGVEDGYLTKINKISTKNVPEGQGPTGTAIREGRYFICNDIENDSHMNLWKDEALKRGFRSSIALPIKSFGNIIGVFSLYSSILHFFDKEEIDLLVKTTDNISFALDKMITEKKEKLAKEEIKNLNKTLEHKVIERTAQLDAVNKELQTFTYSVSHDLKAPLRGIDGYSNLLQELYAADLNEEAQNFIRSIRKGTAQMNLLIEDLLNYSRLERAALSIETIKIKTLLETLKTQYEPEISASKCTFNIKVPDIEIISDTKGLTIALRNLIDNALKFSKENKKPTIDISLKDKPDFWLIAVKDNGIGFDIKYKDRIFEIFQQLNLPEEFPGTGIGLAMVYKSMEKMGGKVRAESIVGKGATFYLEIPKK